jgi:pimeloyl-ACP methyl ester carboxylesterase
LISQTIEFIDEYNNSLNNSQIKPDKKFVEYNGYKLHFHSYGNGKQALLAFHGFNRSSADWAVFEKHIGDIFTIYAFDIFYHGKSKIDEAIQEPYIGKTELSELVSRFMMENKLARISLIGYSLGGKLVLSLIETMPGQIDNVFILAPDGIKNHFWNSFATRSFIGRILFNHAIKDPRYVLKISSFLLRSRIINKKFDLFIRTHLQEKDQRLKVLNIWMLFKDLIPEKKRIRKHVLRYKINFQMFFGKYDAIIPPKSGETFAAQLNLPCFHLLDCGHNMSGVIYEICTVIKNSVSIKRV